MVTIAAQENPEFGPPCDEEGARAAILAAARKLAEREGVIEMTLTGVAKEAKVSAASIFQLFSSKEDLVLAAIADDLATLARTMRRNSGGQERAESPQSPADPAAPVPPVLQERVGAPPSEPLGTASGGNTENAQDLQEAQTTTMNQPLSAATQTSAHVEDMPRRFPVVQVRREQLRPAAPDATDNTAETLARIQEALAKLEARPVDAWLERRLREFERGLASLQGVHAERGTADNSTDQALQTLSDSVAALERRQTAATDEASREFGIRIGAFDQRLREALSDLQSESIHIARRVTALENLAFATRPEMMPPPVACAPIAELTPETTIEQPPAGNEVADDRTETKNESPPSYLAAARRSAQAAAQANEEFRRTPAMRKPRTLLYAACGSLLLFVTMIAGAGLMLRNATMNAQPVHIAERAAPAKTVRLAMSKTLTHTTHTAGVTSQSGLRKRAETGDPAAELLVGLQYLDGKDVPRNDAVAVDWLSRAAARGQPVAQYDLGALYADGRGVPTDAVQAFQWFGAAALRGNRRAMHFLAIAYAEGVGTTKNLPEAARWFERSAMLGAVNSQFNIAVLYERGMGVPQSLTTAYKWYAIAAAQGDREAQARVTALASELKPDDLASARTAADSFKPEPLDPAANLPPKLPS